MSSFTNVACFAVLHCTTCHMAFGIPDSFCDLRQRDHKTFSCPQGHNNWYGDKSEAEKLRDELTHQKHRAEQAEADAREQRRRREVAQRSVTARKAVTTRLKNRLAKGSCPCCSHTFKDLKAHMKTQHSDWNPDKHADALEAKGAR